jgi:hypothetical protein
MGELYALNTLVSQKPLEMLTTEAGDLPSLGRGDKDTIIVANPVRHRLFTYPQNHFVVSVSHFFQV